MNDANRPSLARRAIAVVIATIAGVAVVLLLLWATDSLTGPSPLDGSSSRLPLPFFFPFGLVVGTFIGIPLCLLIGMPLWQVALLLGWHRRHEAASCGAASGLAIAVLLPLWLGMPSPAARWDYAVLFIGSFVIAGVCAGLVAHHIAYPDRP